MRRTRLGYGKMTARLTSETGYSLIELIIVIVIVAIIASVAVKALRGTNEVVRTEETKAELEQLAYAVAGNPVVLSGGARTDYGYVGDVGALPPNLDALVTNPGGYGTWDGPYVRDDFYVTAGGASSEFKLDGWGRAYVYSGGNSIVSTGSGSSISRNIANATDDLLYNDLSIAVVDIDNDLPGTVFRDSVRIVLTHPDGAGGYTSRTTNPDGNGLAVFDSIPIGRHTLRTVYLPTNDTLTRLINIDPGRSSYLQTQLFSDVW